MIRELTHDEELLSQRCEPATAEDAPLAQDLLDTLASIEDGGCLAANQIGETKAVIAFLDDKGNAHVMYNPKIMLGLRQHVHVIHQVVQLARPNAEKPWVSRACRDGIGADLFGERRACGLDGADAPTQRPVNLERHKATRSLLAQLAGHVCGNPDAPALSYIRLERPPSEPHIGILTLPPHAQVGSASLLVGRQSIA